MDKSKTAKLCKDVEHAADQFRSISGQDDVADALGRFWQIQDSLHRLLETVDEEGDEITHSRTVIRHVVRALESPLAKSLTHIPAVKDAHDQINALLLRLERVTSQR